LEDNRVSVDVTITVDYGSPIPDVARNIQENVKKAIETMSGLDVKNVDVHVTGISFEREQRANAELDEQHRKMLEKTAENEAEGAPKEAPGLPPEAPEAEKDEPAVEATVQEKEAEDLKDADVVEEAPEFEEVPEDDGEEGYYNDEDYTEEYEEEEAAEGETPKLTK
jgi:hypothetical protein